MEKLDRRILALLARDGRMSYTDIGRKRDCPPRRLSSGYGVSSSVG
jgi:DNA-binding Lrp family transcriptional regulator